MKIEIDESVCNKYGLTIDEILVLIGLSKGSKEIYNNLLALVLIVKSFVSFLVVLTNQA